MRLPLHLYCLVFVSLCIPSFVVAEINRFQFVTSPQTIVHDTTSSPITIQAQNQNDEKEVIEETYDLTFVSTSPTGNFLGSSGKTVTKTMAKGTAQRTFYYSDSTLGTYTLTVTAVGRTTKKSFSASQSISVVQTLPKTTPVIKKTTTKNTPSKQPLSSLQKNVTAVASVVEAQTQASSEEKKIIYTGIPHRGMFDSLFDIPGNFWKWIVSFF